MICHICDREHPQGLGGTTMAMILGVHPSGEDALDVYHDLTRPRIEREGKLPIDFLRRRTHEPTAAMFYFSETGRSGRKTSGPSTHPDYPAFQCHPDYDVFAEEDKGTGVLEIKAPRAKRVTEIVDHGLKQSEIIQLQTYLAVTRRSWGSFGIYAMEHSHGLIIVIDQEADTELGKFLLETGQRFFEQHVLKRDPPDQYEWAALRENPETPEFVETSGDVKVVTEDTTTGKLTRLVLEAMDVRKEAEELEKARKAALEEHLADAGYDTDRLQIPQIARVTLVKQQGRKSFAKKSLMGHRPIDRDKLRAWMLNQGQDGPKLEALMAALELDLNRFEKRGAPYQFLRLTPSKGE